MTNHKISKNQEDYNILISNICSLLDEGRKQAYQVVDQILVNTYWMIGRQIVEYEQKGKERAEYGSSLLKELSKDLKIRYSKGFTTRNIYLMRKFYINFRNLQTLSAKLSWSHYVDLLSIKNTLEINFYEKQCLIEKWSIRELRRQVKSSLFYRISKDKSKLLEISKKGDIVKDSRDIIREPYVLEFLNLSEKYNEKELEDKIMDNLQMFLLELGRGFTFVARQKRINMNNYNYYIDLVFYHKILKCFVLIDLKIGRIIHSDVGQMNMYLNYYKYEESSNEDNAPVGIIFSAQDNNIDVKYTLGGITNKLFISKYILYLPDKKELKEFVERFL